MIDISLYKINKNYGFDNLYKDLCLEIKSGEHVALIGDNGCGKSSLLNIIAGLENIDSGNISIRNNLKIGYLKQINNYDMLVKDLLYSKFNDIYNIYMELLDLERNLNDKNINKYIKLQDKYNSLNGYLIDSKINKLTSIFNINDDILNMNFNDLSGGFKTIISLILILLDDPDLLLLDEPTNHLDINMLELLENYLFSFKGSFILVSHDRYFINKVVNKIILIENKNIDIYHGNYNYYLEEYKIRKDLKIKEYNNQVKTINKMEKSIKKLQEFGKIGDNEAFFRRANSIQKRLDKMDRIDKPISKKNIPINFNIDDRTGKEVIKLNNYDLIINNKVLINNINLDIFYQDRICIMGNNGCGKSSLIKKIINNNMFGSNVKIGYIPQEIKFDNEKITLIEEVRKYYIGDESHLRSALNKFLFSKDNIYKRLDKLSGGERVRLKLFCLIQNNNNVLILDEVTNHIDIFTREILEIALLNYNGTIIFISHDRYFIDKIATKIAYISNKSINTYIGNYSSNIRKLNVL